MQNSLTANNGTTASFGPRVDRLAPNADADPLAFLAKVGAPAPTSQEWLEAFDWKLTKPELLFYWLTMDMYFQSTPQQSSHLQVFHVVPVVSRISKNGK